MSDSDKITPNGIVGGWSEDGNIEVAFNYQYPDSALYKSADPEKVLLMYSDLTETQIAACGV